MRIAIVSTHVPFVHGGAEILADTLGDQLREHGHRVEQVRLPFRWYPAEKTLDHMLAARLMRLPGIDRVIGLKFPAYLVPHDDKVFWILHQHRQAYDFWGTPFQGIPDSPSGRSIRQAIFDADAEEFGGSRPLFTISRVNAERMRRFNGITPEVLYPPLASADGHTCEPAEDFVFYPSRLVANKRQALAIESMAHVTSGTRLVLAGRPERPEELDGLQRLIAEHGVGDRVELFAGWLPEERKLELMARSLATLYTPYDEDFGYVTLESFHAAKPVITCADSGGALELVRDGESGLVAQPKPQAIADAIDRLSGDRPAAARMGEAGREQIRALDISWANVVEKLTAR
jgi:glycosyltransferase involved in cell wall biosynthesis